MDMHLVSYLYVIITIDLWKLTLAKIICPPKLCYCSEDSELWSCKIETDQQQIDCSKNLVNSKPVKINLDVIDFTFQRKLSFFNNCKIEILKISSNSVPSNQIIRNIESLNYLIIDGTQKNSLLGVSTELENLLSGFNVLKRLRIENIKLESWFSGYLSVCQSVEIIVLKNLQLETIDHEAFVKCFRLKRLTITLNRILTISILSFKGLKYLTQLTLSSNQCQYLTTNGNGWQEISNLEKLDLSTNRITSLTMDMFTGLAKLEQLQLNNNELEFIDHLAFEGLTSLKYLNLEKNSKLIVFDLRCLDPMKKTLIRININLIQCVDWKSKLSSFRNEIQKFFQSSTDCQVPIETTSTTSAVSELLPLKTGSPNMVLIVVIAVVVTLLVVGIFVGVFTGCSMKKKIRKYKNNGSDRLTSRSNSVRLESYSRSHTFQNHVPFQNGTQKLLPRCSSIPIMSNSSV